MMFLCFVVLGMRCYGLLFFWRFAFVFYSGLQALYPYVSRAGYFLLKVKECSFQFYVSRPGNGDGCIVSVPAVKGYVSRTCNLYISTVCDEKSGVYLSRSGYAHLCFAYMSLADLHVSRSGYRS